MTRLETSWQALPSCDVKVYSSHEIYDSNNEVSDIVIGTGTDLYRFGVLESYNGKSSLEEFESMLNAKEISEDYGYNLESIDYAIIEIKEDQSHIDLYSMGDCEIFIKYDNEWFEFYDLMHDETKIKDSLKCQNELLGYPKELSMTHVKEIILATNSSGLNSIDLNDRIADEHNFMTDVSFDETNDIRVMHIKFS